MDSPLHYKPEDFAHLPIAAVITGAQLDYPPREDPSEFTLFTHSKGNEPKGSYIVHGLPSDEEPMIRKTVLVRMGAVDLMETFGMEAKAIRPDQLTPVPAAGKGSTLMRTYGPGVDLRNEESEAMICQAAGLEVNSATFSRLRTYLETESNLLPRRGRPIGSIDGFYIINGEKKAIPASLGIKSEEEGGATEAQLQSQQQQEQKKREGRVM